MGDVLPNSYNVHCREYTGQCIECPRAVNSSLVSGTTTIFERSIIEGGRPEQGYFLCDANAR